MNGPAAHCRGAAKVVRKFGGVTAIRKAGEKAVKKPNDQPCVTAWPWDDDLQKQQSKKWAKTQQLRARQQPHNIHASLPFYDGTLLIACASQLLF